MKVRSIVKKVRHQAGVTILEFIAFIGLAALVIAGALSLYGSGSAGAAANDVVSTANGVVATLRATYPNGVTVALTKDNLNIAGAPAGWTVDSAAATPKIIKGARSITLANGVGTFDLTINAGDNNLCKQINASNQPVGGKTAKTGACNGNDNLVYEKISLP